MSTHNHDDKDLKAEGLGYEPRDVSLIVLVKWLVALFVFVAVSSVGAALTYLAFTTFGKSGSEWRVPREAHVPPEGYPLVQARPAPDIKDFRVREDQALTSYGWVNRPAGIAKIPVERAIDILAAKGLPDKSDSSRVEHFVPAGFKPASALGMDAPDATGAVR